MCQLLGLSASDPVRLTFNWESFVVRGSWDGGNPDGWGVAYFNNADAQIFREPVPAAESPMVQFLARNAPLSTTVVSHVRRAVGSALKLANTQPFARTLGGHTHVFAHNGFVSLPWPVNDLPWLKPVGDTDSEALFSRLLEQIAPLWQCATPPELDNRLEALRQFADEIRQCGAANFLYSDGITLFAHAHRRTVPGDGVSSEPGLFILSRNSKEDSADETPCRGLNAEQACGRQAYVATEPLDDQAWLPMAPGEIACFEAGRRIR